jgi:hypothetical protein
MFWAWVNRSPTERTSDRRIDQRPARFLEHIASGGRACSRLMCSDKYLRNSGTRLEARGLYWTTTGRAGIPGSSIQNQSLIALCCAQPITVIATMRSRTTPLPSRVKYGTGSKNVQTSRRSWDCFTLDTTRLSVEAVATICPDGLQPCRASFLLTP